MGRVAIMTQIMVAPGIDQRRAAGLPCLMGFSFFEFDLQNWAGLASHFPTGSRNQEVFMSSLGASGYTETSESPIPSRAEASRTIQRHLMDFVAAWNKH